MSTLPKELPCKAGLDRAAHHGQGFPGPAPRVGHARNIPPDIPAAVCIRKPWRFYLQHELETKRQLQKWRCHFAEKDLPLCAHVAVTQMGSRVLTQRKIECGTKTSVEMWYYSSSSMQTTLHLSFTGWKGTPCMDRGWAGRKKSICSHPLLSYEDREV